MRYQFYGIQPKCPRCATPLTHCETEHIRHDSIVSMCPNQFCRWRVIVAIGSDQQVTPDVAIGVLG